MVFVVPFDGSELAQTALVRAAEFSEVLDEDVLAVSVIPEGNASYARERGWVDAGEPFDESAVVSTLHRRVIDLCPSADFRHCLVDEHAAPGSIANRVRRAAREAEASMVFVGSENAGRMVSALSSVGSAVAADDAYDVVLVRHRSPARVARLRESSPHRHEKSDFYLHG